MNNPPIEPPQIETFKDLMALVGEFLFYWSGMEQALSEAILDRHGAGKSRSLVSGSFEDRLKRWRDAFGVDHDASLLNGIYVQADALRRTRNLIVHGLVAGHSIAHKDGEPHIVCIKGGWHSPGDKKEIITAAQLKEFSQAADACRRSFARPEIFKSRI